MDFRIGSWIIVEQPNGQEALVIVSFKNGSGWRGVVPVIDKHLSGMNNQIQSVVRY